MPSGFKWDEQMIDLDNIGEKDELKSPDVEKKDYDYMEEIIIEGKVEI